MDPISADTYGGLVAPIGLTFDDVLLLPGLSDVNPAEAVTRTRLSKRIELQIPLLSSAMDTVTEARMAIAMARQGGIGVLHRNLSIEDQAAQVDLVKRSEAGMVTNPVTCSPDDTLADVDRLCGRYRISGAPVVDADGVLLGIVTNRDMRFESNMQRPVREVMTPMPLVTAPVGVSNEDALRLLSSNKVEKLPIVDDSGHLKGLITVKDFVKKDQYPLATKDSDGRLRVAAAIGFHGDAFKRAMALVDAGVDAIIVDVAQGHGKGVHDMIAALKAETAAAHVDVIGGNVATRAGAQALVEVGADGVKVGVGPGCFAAGTRVLMADGSYKDIEKIVAGDRVITGDGLPTTVVKAWCTGVREVVAVRHSNNDVPTLATRDHRYLTAARAMALAGAPEEPSRRNWIQIGDVEGQDLLFPDSVQFEGNASVSSHVRYGRVELLGVRETGLSVPVYDIEVEAESHSFIADNAIVHNSICTTRVVAGVGVPQVTAIYEASRACKAAGVPVIGDGGLQYSGDIAKALVAGADSVMLGSLLAGVEESPGELVFTNGKQFKTYRGMGSLGAMSSRGEQKSFSKDRYSQADVASDDKLIPEGVEGQVPYRGPLAAVAHQLIGGLRQSMYYVGAATVPELQEKGQFVRITAAGLKESHPHDIQMTVEAPNYSGS